MLHRQLSRALTWICLALSLWAGRAAPPRPAKPPKPGELPRLVAPGVEQVGYLFDERLRECSGIIPCATNRNLFWVHNDGPGSSLLAINRTGRVRAEYVITGAAITDWEDLAHDNEGNLYISDTGNNECRRTLVAVHQIPEPDPEKPFGIAKISRSWRLMFPGKPFDCESLFIWQGHGYLISKVTGDAQAEIFRFSLHATNHPIRLEYVVRLPITSPVAGADISSDGSKLALVAKNGLHLFQINGEVASAGTAARHHIKFRGDHVEGCCFVAEGVLATAESREIYLFSDKTKRKAP